MMLRTILMSLVLGGAMQITAPAAEAQDWSLSFGKQSRHGHFSVALGNRGPQVSHRYGGHRYGRPGYAPHRCWTRQVWVPGRYEYRERQVWIPGQVRREWIPPVYRTRYSFGGRPCQVLERAGYWREWQEPGYYETRVDRVWVPEHYRTVKGCHCR